MSTPEQRARNRAEVEAERQERLRKMRKRRRRLERNEKLVVGVLAVVMGLVYIAICASLTAGFIWLVVTVLRAMGVLA